MLACMHACTRTCVSLRVHDACVSLSFRFLFFFPFLSLSLVFSPSLSLSLSLSLCACMYCRIWFKKFLSPSMPLNLFNPASHAGGPVFFISDPAARASGPAFSESTFESPTVAQTARRTNGHSHDLGRQGAGMHPVHPSGAQTAREPVKNTPSENARFFHF
jgi:hypothetical protein